MSDSKKGSGEKYVVTHTMVDAWPRGTVLDREAFRSKVKDGQGGETDVDTFDRLTALNAIRPATDAEKDLSFVETVQGGTTSMSTSAQEMLAAKDAEIDRLRRQLGDRREIAAFHQANPGREPARATHAEQTAAQRESEHVARLADEKDAQIAMIKEQIKKEDEKIAAAGVGRPAVTTHGGKTGVQTPAKSPETPPSRESDKDDSKSPKEDRGGASGGHAGGKTGRG